MTLMVGTGATPAPADPPPDTEQATVVERLTAELAAAEDAITDLVGELEAAHAAGFVSPPSIWWSA